MFLLLRKRPKGGLSEAEEEELAEPLAPQQSRLCPLHHP